MIGQQQSHKHEHINDKVNNDDNTNKIKNQELQITAKFVGVADDGKIQIKLKGIDNVTLNVDERYVNTTGSGGSGGSTVESISSHSKKRSSIKVEKKEKKKKKKTELDKAADAAWGDSDDDDGNDGGGDDDGKEEQDKSNDNIGSEVRIYDASELSIGDEKFHPKHKYKTIEVDQGGSLIRTTEDKSVMCAFGSIECSEEGKIYQWKVQIIEGNDVNLGVIFSETCKKNKKQMWWLADEGYSYWGDDGQIYHSDKYKKYGAKYGAGDVIDVILNLKKYNVSFAKNGEKYGKAFKVNKEKGYRLGVGVSGGGHVLQLISFTCN